MAGFEVATEVYRQEVMLSATMPVLPTRNRFLSV